MGRCFSRGRVASAKPQPPFGRATRGFVETRKRNERPFVFTAADFRAPFLRLLSREGKERPKRSHDVADSQPHGPLRAPHRGGCAAPCRTLRVRQSPACGGAVLRRSAGCGLAYVTPPPHPSFNDADQKPSLLHVWIYLSTTCAPKTSIQHTECCRIPGTLRRAPCPDITMKNDC